MKQSTLETVLCCLMEGVHLSIAEAGLPAFEHSHPGGDWPLCGGSFVTGHHIDWFTDFDDIDPNGYGGVCSSRATARFSLVFGRCWPSISDVQAAACEGNPFGSCYPCGTERPDIGTEVCGHPTGTRADVYSLILADREAVRKGLQRHACACLKECLGITCRAFTVESMEDRTEGRYRVTEFTVAARY